MSGASTMATLTVAVWLAVEPVPLTVSTSDVPAVSDGPAAMVSVDVPAPDVADAGANDAVRPVGGVGEVSATFSATPVVLVNVTVTSALPPAGTEISVGET